MSMLRELFGPSKDEIWQRLCAEIGAEFVPGGFWRGNKVQARVRDWTVTLDLYTVSTGQTHHHYTRIRAPFVNADGFHFQIYRAGVFSEVGKRLGMQDIEVGFPDFDAAFIIKGNDETRLRQLFSYEKIRALLLAQPDVHFEVVDDEGWFGAQFPDGVDELRFQVSGVLKDVVQLKQLFELFAVTLDQLCLMGAAYVNDPKVAL
jgi:hypothetical protein